MTLRSLIFSCVFSALALYPAFSQAAERLLYDSQAGASSRIALEDYAQKALGEPLSALDFAKVDLNDDSLPEFILRDKSCSGERAICAYNVWAETDQGVISLGTVRAKTLLLGNERSHGVRNLMAFTDTHNDYAYSVFVWNPTEKRFEEKDQQAP